MSKYKYYGQPKEESLFSKIVSSIIIFGIVGLLALGSAMVLRDLYDIARYGPASSRPPELVRYDKDGLPK